ncbi:hypothetical protein BH23BAC4_BH23BAC4_00520 [soil metagenome]
MKNSLRWLGAVPALALLILLTGCSDYLYSIPGHDRRPTRTTVPAPNRADERRVERDVNNYVNQMHRQLRLDRNQQQRISSILHQRTWDTMRHRNDRVRHPRDRHPGDRNARAMYPFPRHAHADNRQKQDWWRATDRSLERHLSRRQVEEYRYMTGEYRRDSRGRGNQGRGNQGRGNRGRGR